MFRKYHTAYNIKPKLKHKIIIFFKFEEYEEEEDRIVEDVGLPTI